MRNSDTYFYLRPTGIEQKEKVETLQEKQEMPKEEKATKEDMEEVTFTFKEQGSMKIVVTLTPNKYYLYKYQQGQMITVADIETTEFNLLENTRLFIEYVLEYSGNFDLDDMVKDDNYK